MKKAILTAIIIFIFYSVKSQSSASILFDSLQHGNYYLKGKEKQFSGPIYDSHENIIGKSIITYSADLGSKTLFKVLKVDSFNSRSSIVTLYYYNNNLLRSESWNESSGKITDRYTVYYSGKNIILVDNNATNKNKSPNYYDLSKEYLSTLL